MADKKSSPKFVNGEPVCDIENCQLVVKYKTMYPCCEITGRTCFGNDPCWPAIKEQRDAAIKEMKELDDDINVIERERDEWKARVINAGSKIEKLCLACQTDDDTLSLLSIVYEELDLPNDYTFNGGDDG